MYPQKKRCHSILKSYQKQETIFVNLARLAEFDPEGVAEHCRFAGIEVPKEKPQKTKKQSRGKER